MGKKPVLDEGKRKEICAVLSVGCSRKTAAAFVRCDPSTIRRTAQRDPSFFEQLRQAEARPGVMAANTMIEASKETKTWRAAAWLLERLDTEQFGRQERRVTSKRLTQILTKFADAIAEVLPEASKAKVLEMVRQLMIAARSDEDVTG